MDEGLIITSFFDIILMTWRILARKFIYFDMAGWRMIVLQNDLTGKPNWYFSSWTFLKLHWKIIVNLN